MFITGEGFVIPAWDIAVITMKSGELVELIVPPQFAFGPLGCPPRIPGNTTLKYEIELLRFAAPLSDAARKNEIKLSFEETLESCKASRFEGNNLVNSNSLRKATKCYNRALNYLNRLGKITEEQQVLVNEAKIPLFSNLSLCHLRLKDYKRAITSCEDVSFSYNFFQ